MLFVGPGAAGTIKAIRLIGPQQRGGGIERIHLRTNGDSGGF
jgi:hypothetical protein